MIPTIYLAGPIKGLTFTEATTWRRTTKALLPEFQCIDPVERTLSQFKGALGDSAPGLLSSSKAIVVKDRDHVARSSAVLLNLTGAKAVSIGTMVELGWADARRLPIVVVMEPSGNIHDHAFVREIAGWVVPTIEDACFVLRNLFEE